jgi:alcohol dehydrogenase class IV
MFSFFSPQAIHFGRGQSTQAPSLARAYGNNLLLVHGANAQRAEWLVSACTDTGMTVRSLGCQNEPSLPDVQLALAQLKGFNPDVVIALGGGAVIDFAKALAALIPCASPPQEYLEVVGTGRPLDHAPLPLIALPTTAGTGAEVTKNAVITVPEHGIKVSLRDPRMIPDIAIVDAGLMQGAPRRVTLSAGLDAITQVIEPYLTIKANTMTDALCLAAIPTGLGAIRDVVENDDPAAWDAMARVSTWGGLALANAGLGAVHGFAGVIGGRTNAPHGEICGALLPAVLSSHQRKAQDGTDIKKRLTWVLDQIDQHFNAGGTGNGLSQLKAWSREMGLRGLGDMGLRSDDLQAAATASAGASSMKGNPFALSQHELVEILTDAL